MQFTYKNLYNIIWLYSVIQFTFNSIKSLSICFRLIDAKKSKFLQQGGKLGKLAAINSVTKLQVNLIIIAIK